MALGSSDSEKFRRAFVLLLALGISAIFFAMIRSFLIALLLAAIFSALVYPLYRRLLRLFRERASLASAATILLVLLLVVGPLTGFLGLVASQAYQVSQKVKPWIQEQIAQEQDEGLLEALQDRIPQLGPLVEKIEPYRSDILTKLGELAGAAGSFLFDRLSAATKGTVTFFLNLFIMLYAMFFFLIDGRGILDRMVYVLPLPAADKERMLDRFVSVSRATLKGTVVIGIIQGTLAGLAFVVVGIDGALFWGTIMALLSIIPAVGSALIWVPAVVYLLLAGKIAAGVGLAVWCAVVVGTADNFLRPRLVGSDAQLPDLLILLGTLGGLAIFGVVGFILGPVIAALFLTVWDIYGTTFKEALTGPAGAEGGGSE